MKRIKLTQNKYALIDGEDYSKISEFNWHACKDDYRFYARKCLFKGRKKTSESMHRMILNYPDAKWQVDHINGDTLDNRKSNLRLVTQSQNQANRGLPITNTSGYKGVHKSYGKWRSVIYKNGRRIHLGMFQSIQEAAKVYNKKALELFGEYAKLNNASTRA